MIIYEATKTEFISDITNELLIERLYKSYQEKIGRTSKSEITSWENSLQRMCNVMQDKEIPRDAAVAIEFKIPNTSKRVDFLVAGNNGNQDHVVIVELKQWSEVEKIESKDAVISTYLGGGARSVTHPSYQAWSYAALISDFNENVQEQHIELNPCAYLHNYRKIDNDPLTDVHYEEHLAKAPVFTKGEIQKLRSFIKQYVRKGDKNRLIYQIEHGRIRPSKSLQDNLSSMLDGNEEFIMIDEQKIFYEDAYHLATEGSKITKKQVMVIEGGPGTGKSVMAVNLLVNLINQGLMTLYVSKNSAPREVYASKLKGTITKTEIDNLFKGSGSFTKSELNEFDVIVVDEAHRLNEKSGFYGNQGENQIKELINASKFTLFFIDEKQRVTLKDIGSLDVIKKYAEEFDAELITGMLTSQFRCDGSDAYIAWLEDVLQIRETANTHDYGVDYDFRVFDDPHAMLHEIEKLNQMNNKSRMLAGYCWEWPTKERKNTNFKDIIIPEQNFEISWNLTDSIWAIDQDSVSEAGCIHTAQGLEFDYVGVIIGPDLIYKDGFVQTDYTKRAKSDQSLKGIKKIAKEDPEKAQTVADEIIRNTYRTLMTRGQKGCFIFCTDPELNQYFQSRLKKTDVYQDFSPINYKVAEDRGMYD
ncbi:DNA/RNA helicase domain-containing protein [Virgibacillus flavescens]|uniref:DNA/RNA helicase domain-containing protein n=1 Tax=Virgibacillus flavescens TaxID=1611422 RepID=UPI003D335BFD